MTLPPMLETKDASTIIMELVTLYTTLVPGYVPLEGDDVMPVIEVFAYREMLLRNLFNAQVAGSFWQTATGKDLDFIANFFGLERLTVIAQTDTDPAVMETDEKLRLRIGMSFEGSGTAGSIKGYTYWALQADGRIKDVNVYGLEGGIVVVKIHSSVSEMDSAMLDAVKIALNAEEVRPINDRVQVSAADKVFFDIKATIYCGANVDKSTALLNATDRLNARLGDIKIGQSITEGFIISSLSVDGVLDVSFDSAISFPIVITRDQVAVANSVVVVNG